MHEGGVAIGGHEGKGGSRRILRRHIAGLRERRTDSSLIDDAGVPDLEYGGDGAREPALHAVLDGDGEGSLAGDGGRIAA